MIKKLSVVIACIAVVSTAYSQYDVYSPWDPYSGGNYGSGWTTLTPSTVDTYTGGSRSTTGGTTSGGSTGDGSGTSETTSPQTTTKIDWSTKTEPHNYGVAGLTIPDGAIGISAVRNAFFCLEHDSYWAFGLKRETDGAKIFEKDVEVGEFLVLNQSEAGKTYKVDYGYIYPEKIVADDLMPDNCLPSWYKATGAGGVKPVYVWDPNLDISESSTATSETITCTENYKRRIEIKSGTVYDAENGTNLYYQNTATTNNIAAYNGVKISYPWTGAIIGRTDDPSGTTGFICVQTQEYLDSLLADKTSVDKDSAASPARDFNPTYGLPNFDLPIGSIVVQHSNGAVSCMESGKKISSVSKGSNDNRFYEGNKTVGDITLPNLGGYDYGFIFPQLLSAGEAGVAKSCYPTWYKSRPQTKSRQSKYISKCELAQLLLKTSGEDIPVDFSADFIDLPASRPEAKYVYAGAKKGYWGETKKGSGKFGCDGSASRAEFARIVSKMLKLKKSDEDTYTPSDKTPKWVLPYIRRVHAKGLMEGKGSQGRFFSATKKLKRVEAEAAVKKIFKVNQ